MGYFIKIKKIMVFQTIKYRQGEKKARVALKRIFGIGSHFANQICDSLGISNQKVKGLSSAQLDKLSYFITNNYFFGHDLKNIIQQDKKRLKHIRAFRGIQK